MDLAEAHGTALDHLFERQASDPLTLNIGTGRGLSVLDVVHGFEQATGLAIPYEIVERRPGDVPRLEACPRLHKPCWAGAPAGACKRCAVMAGPGRRPIHPDTEVPHGKGACSSWPAEGTAMRSC